MIHRVDRVVQDAGKTLLPSKTNLSLAYDKPSGKIALD